jgi:preprotein translocase subunit SecF
MIELFRGIKVDWLGKRKLFFAISIVLLGIGMASLLIKGEFHYGLDFKGGTVVNVQFTESVDIGAIRNVLPQASIQAVQSTEGGSQFQIELGKAAENEDEIIGQQAVTAALDKTFAGKFKVLGSESVSAKVGGDLRRQAVMATLYALVGILI